MFFSIIILFVLFLVSCEIYYKNVIRKYSCPLPTPKILPFIGNGHLFIGSPAHFYRALNVLISTLGLTIQAYIVNTGYIFTADPNFIEEVMSSSKLITKSVDYDFLHSWLGQGLLTASGSKWRRSRKFLTPAFHFNILLNFLPIFLKNQVIFKKKLYELADGNDVNIFPIIASVALDNLSETAMGVSINAQASGGTAYVEAVINISKAVHLRMKHPFYRFDIFFHLSKWKKIQDKALATLHEFTDTVIRDRKEVLFKDNITKMDHYDDTGMKRKFAFLDLLILSEFEGEKLSNTSIREEVDTFMFEGHDTTTSGICFTLYCIAKHQDIQQKLYEEQKTILKQGEDEPTYNDLQNMKYLEMVIKESLRLFPSVPLVARATLEDTVINGINIPKGNNIIMSVVHMQRSPKVYEDPLKFKPERFTPEEISKRNPYSWVSFSAGPRNCIGQKYALLEMKVVISSIIRNFTLQTTGEEPILCVDLILKPEKNLNIKFLPRKVELNGIH